jgi:S-adenosylmethionine:tRNA ribosyltransferase-isomerase
MRLQDFAYDLPDAQIARVPSTRRDASRLLHVQQESLRHLTFRDFPGLLRSGDLLVVNDTRVVKARLHGEKDSGGHAEVLVERVEADDVALCQVRVSKPLKPGRALTVGAFALEVLGREGQFYRLRFPVSVMQVLEAEGEVPLPPYIDRPATAGDEANYQTVYARQPGAVAAPTAGLHFTRAMLDALPLQGVEVASVTLHVGAGTFQPVRVTDIQDHHMHFERYEVPAEAAEAVNRARQRGGRIVAVGTTVVRTLETAALQLQDKVADGERGRLNAGQPETGLIEAGRGETDLFITPGFQFRVVDALLTNFHLPESTLLMLVCAFGGYRRVMAAYAAAVAAGYRFFSYGDAMFLERKQRVDDV